jgi:hypothetical protein
VNFLNPRFKSNIIARALLLALVFGLFSGDREVFAAKRNMDEERRNARLQATYITRLVKFIRWDDSSEESKEPFNIVVLGNEDVGFVQSLRFLVNEGDVSVGDRPVVVKHYVNSQSKEALEFVEKGVEFIYFTTKSSLNVSDIMPIRNGAMFIAEGRGFVENESGCIGFVKTRNRMKLVFNETCFKRKFAKVSPVLTSLKSVVEVVKPN